MRLAGCALAGASFVAANCAAACAEPASTQLGVLTAVIAGSHVGFDNPQTTHGVVPGAALEATHRVRRLRIHLEGIPTVAARGSTAGAFGRSSASLDLLNATLTYGVGPAQRVRVGGGFQVVNLTNANGRNGDRNAVRITSPIYAAGATLPLRRDRFVEASVMIDPNVRGILRVAQATGAPRRPEPEVGAEVDYAAALGWCRGAVTYLVGARGLSYHTRDAERGNLIDRNVGAGATFEVRVALGGAR